MKKFTLMLLGLATSAGAFAQTYVAPGKAIAGPEQYESVGFQAKLDQILLAEEMAKTNSTVQSNELSGARTAGTNSIALGSSSNAFTILRTEQNQVYANDATGLVLFGHRNDAGIYGGSSGNLRYDYSTDGGATWTIDVGEVNPQLLRPSRYPNFSAINPTNSSNPNDLKMVYSAPTLNNAPDWDGHVTGVWDIGAATGGTENYALLSQQSYLQGGLCEGLPGEFWTVDVKYDGTALGPEIWVNKGVYDSNTGDIAWSRFDTLSPPHSLSFDGTPTIVGPNISFSPDGMIGYIGWLGDLSGGVDTTLAPCFIKTTDGGATWGPNYEEFNFNTVGWIADSLQALWTDSFFNPVSSGEGTTGFDYDMIVDGAGNVHFAVVVGSRSTTTADPGYSIYSGLAKFMADITYNTTTGLWDAIYLSPVLTFRTPPYGTSTTVTMDNNCQISRTPDGTILFYSWADSDTAQFTGSMNGIGFGESDNLAPNLRYTARHAVTGALSYPTLVTDGDLTWEGRALFPTMAPEVVACANGWSLPIVLCEFQDPIGQTFFHYFGDQTCFDPARLCDPTGLVLGWTSVGADPQPPCTAVSNEVPSSSEIEIGVYPNPTAGEAVITFNLPETTVLSLEIRNVYGQTVSVVTEGEYNAGAHKATVQTQDLAAGVYFYSLVANGKSYTKKMIVSK